MWLRYEADSNNIESYRFLIVANLMKKFYNANYFFYFLSFVLIFL